MMDVLPRNVAHSAIIARAVPLRLDCVKEDLLLRYNGDDADVLAWLADISSACAHLVTLDRLLRAGLTNAKQRAQHAHLQAAFIALIPAISDVLGGLDTSSVFVALVQSAGASCWRQGDRVGVVGHA
jgi:hypothetical protein